MQTGIDESWFDEEDPEKLGVSVVIEGVTVREHEIPLAFLEEEFSGPEARREFVYEQLESMAFSATETMRNKLWH